MTILPVEIDPLLHEESRVKTNHLDPPRLDQADHAPQTNQVLPEMSLAFLVSTTSAKSPPLRYT